MRHDARTGSRGRLLAAAAEIFAAKGFDGAKVDRIARTAGVNKAMIYYHFGSKLGLYRQVLRAVYSQAGEQVQSVARSDA